MGMEKRAAPNDDAKPTGVTAAARHNGMRRRPTSEPVSSKMANMIIHENYRDGTSRASARHSTCPPGECALETVASVRAALTDASLDLLAFPGSRLAGPSAGFMR
jgi:hypothetical protein